MKDILIHTGMTLGVILAVWLSYAFVSANINPFTYSLDERSGMLFLLIVLQLFCHIGYSISRE